MKPKKIGMVAITLALAGSVSACVVYPKMVRQITGNDKNIKFVYDQQGEDMSGVIRCEVGEKGKLTNCRDLELRYVEDEE